MQASQRCVLSNGSKTMIKKAGFLALLLLLSTGSAHAVKFGVHVVSEAGEPVPGVAVCFGTHGNFKQYGAIFTTTSGDAIMDVPNVPLVVTISKNRFTGIRITEPSRRFNLVKQITLRDGVPGPRCRAGSSLADGSPDNRLEINDVLVEDGIYAVSLFPTVTGQPSHYRVSNTQSFNNSKWQKYSTTINLTGSLAEQEAVYLQLRRYKAESKGWFEARSNVVSVQIPKL